MVNSELGPGGAEGVRPNQLSEEEKVALLGRPKLGEITRSQIRIKESKEFKVYIYNK